MAAEIILVGRATADATEVNNVNGKKMAKFSLAVNRRFDREKTDFISVLLFGNLCDFALNYVKKGGSFRVSGTITTDTYTDREGVSQKDVTVSANAIKFANGANENCISIDGNITRDAEIRYSTGEKQQAFAHYSIAVNRGKTSDGKELVDYFDITSIGRDAEFAEKYFKKGTPVLVRGEVQKSTWTDRDGKNHRSVMVITDKVCLGAKRNDGADGAGNTGNAEADVPSFIDGPNGFMSIPDGIIEELPFT